MRIERISSSPENKDRLDHLVLWKGNSKDEAAIWKDFLAGSDEALAHIYRTYASKLSNYGRQIISDADVVNDSIQDLFFELINKREKLGETTSVKNYLYASLRRRLVRSKAKVKKYKADDPEGKFNVSFLKDDHTPLDQFSTERIALLEKACNELPERQREAILLLYFEELEYHEVARIMNIGKVRSARALIYRAIESLKTILEPIKNEMTLLFPILAISYWLR